MPKEKALWSFRRCNRRIRREINATTTKDTMSYDALDIALIFGKIILIFLVILTIAAYLVLAERKLLGRIQERIRSQSGRAIRPAAASCRRDQTAHQRGFQTRCSRQMAVLSRPCHGGYPGHHDFCGNTLWCAYYPVRTTGRHAGADLNVGLLFFIAFSSIAVYGTALGGWASNSKYALLGSIRGLAQLISYEITMGLSLVPVVMLARSFQLSEIVKAQQVCWFIVYQPLAFIIFLISIFAECQTDTLRSA